VFRESLVRETITPKWRQVLITMRRPRYRGEIRDGRFVRDLIGEQFELPLAVESARSTQNLAKTVETVTVSAADRLNRAGIAVPVITSRRVLGE
jgi:ATP-dependent Lhr-like helicase